MIENGLSVLTGVAYSVKMQKIIQGLIFSAMMFVCVAVLAEDASVKDVPAKERIPVTVKPLKQLAIHPVVSVPASVVSRNDSKISAEVNAVIKSIRVEVGQTVKRGSVLLELDSEYYRLAYEKSKAISQSIQVKMVLAKFQLERAQRLSKQKVLSEELLAQREAELRSLEADLVAQDAAVSIAKLNLDKCTVRSPFNAVVKQHLAHVGELAAIGTPLIRVIDADNLEISAKIQAADLASLNAAKNIELRSHDKTYQIAVKNITAAYDTLERSQEVRFSFVSGSELPGAYGKISWQKISPHVPSDLMVRRNGQLGVFVLRDNESRFVVFPEAREGQPVEQSQLLETVSIIVDGRFRLQDGSKVVLKK